MNRGFFYVKELVDRVMVFRDRWDAGAKLGNWLSRLGVSADLVYGIPAGGLPVAYMVTEKLGVRLDILVCRKVLIPWNREAGFGAVSPDGWYFIDESLARYLGLSEEEIREAVREQLDEIKRRITLYRCGEPYNKLSGEKVIVIDDGVAAGYTMTAAIHFLERLGAGEIIIAVPTCHVESAKLLLSRGVSSIYCMNPRSGPVYAVADAYIEWRDLEDEDVLSILRKAKQQRILYYKGECLK